MDFVNVALIGHAHGNRGVLKIRLESEDALEQLGAGRTVYVFHPELTERQELTVQSVVPHRHGFHLIRFDELRRREGVEPFRGGYVQVRG